MSDFKFEQNVVPVQHVNTDTSGGAGGQGGDSSALAFGYNTSHAGDGGEALGGSGGDASGGNGTGVGVGGPGGGSEAHSAAGDANQFGLLNLNLGGGPTGGDSVAASQGGAGGGGFGQGIGGSGGVAGNGGDASADGGNATTYGLTSANSSADGGSGGHGGDANVNAAQNTGVSNHFDFDKSFNTDNHTTYIGDSFNHDGNGVDNQGGNIDNSAVAGHNMDDSFNTHNELDYTQIKDSGNSFVDNHSTDIDINHVFDIL